MSKKFILPVAVLLLALGIFVGMKIQNAVSDDKITSQVRKFNDALEVTSRYYVDDVDSQKLTEDAIKGMLQNLDPHSVYITAEQLKSLEELLGRLKRAFSIPTANFIGHGDIAPTRKNDPNWRFPWKQFADQGYGLWWGDTTGVNLPANFDRLSALRIVGFDVKDTMAAWIGFKRHWLQDTTKYIDPAQEKVLYLLSKKFQ